MDQRNDDVEQRRVSYETSLAVMNRGEEATTWAQTHIQRLEDLSWRSVLARTFTFVRPYSSVGEQSTHNRLVVGSKPTGATILCVSELGGVGIYPKRQ